MADLLLPFPPPRYDARREQDRDEALTRADRNNVKRWDLEAWPLERIYLTSPDGSKWRLAVDDLGVLTVEAV